MTLLCTVELGSSGEWEESGVQVSQTQGYRGGYGE